MSYHNALWNTLNHIAEINHISCSCLARRCGLDSTIFNPSKRLTKYGQPRWISTETLAKVLINANITPIEFAQIFETYLKQK